MISPGLRPAHPRAPRSSTARTALASALTIGCLGLAACASDEDPLTETTGNAVDVSAQSTPAAGGSNPRACTNSATAEADPSIAPIATGTTPNLPVTYTDSRNKQVDITAAGRVLALDVAGTLATTVYALGLGDRLVGRDVSTGIPELADLPVVTHNGHELNGEAILDLDPDVILTDYGIGPLEVQLQIEDSGIPIVILSDQRNRSTIAPQIREVAKVFGVAELGDQLAKRVESDIAAAEAEVERLAPSDPAERLRMAFLYMRGAAGVYSWLGKGSGADDLIASLKGIDVAGELGIPASRPINAEGLVQADPDLFLMMSHGLESVGGVTGLQDVPGVADTDAGRNGCVVDMIDYQVLSFGPQFPATLRAMTKAVYEQAAPR